MKKPGENEVEVNSEKKKKPREFYCAVFFILHSDL